MTVTLRVLILSLCAVACGTKLPYKEPEQNPGPAPEDKATSKDGTTSSGGMFREGTHYRCYSHVADGGYRVEVFLPKDPLPTTTDVTLYPESIAGPGKPTVFTAQIVAVGEAPLTQVKVSQDAFDMLLRASSDASGNPIVTGELAIKDPLSINLSSLGIWVVRLCNSNSWKNLSERGSAKLWPGILGLC